MLFELRKILFNPSSPSIMITIYSDLHHRHHGTELKDGKLTPSFECPQRAQVVLERVHTTALGDVIAPNKFEPVAYMSAHSERYVEFLSTAWSEWAATGRTSEALPLVWPVSAYANSRMPDFIDGKLGYFSMDAGSPIGPNTWEVVAESANVALTGIDWVCRSQSAFALCRPPGHHAGREYAGGYCYLNNAAIAAERALTHGADRVAILDIDYHHGNGTQDIFYRRSDVLFVSLHGDPDFSYPYFAGYSDQTGEAAGEGFTLNLPLPRGTDWERYRVALDVAINKISRFKPDVLIVSLGVDTFAGDPISHFRLQSEDYSLMGQSLARLSTPTLFVMEGGYLVDAIGVNTVNVLRAFENG